MLNKWTELWTKEKPRALLSLLNLRMLDLLSCRRSLCSCHVVVALPNLTCNLKYDDEAIHTFFTKASIRKWERLWSEQDKGTIEYHACHLSTKREPFKYHMARRERRHITITFCIHFRVNMDTVVAIGENGILSLRFSPSTMRDLKCSARYRGAHVLYS